jgi:hypothetical protein
MYCLPVMFVRACGAVRGLCEQFSELSTNHVNDLMNRMMELVTNVSEKLDKERLPKMVYDYYASGAEDHWTLKKQGDLYVT